MALPNVFSKEIVAQLIERINKITPQTQPKWGTMNATQMLAHSNVTYEFAFDERKGKPNFLMGFFLKAFVKPIVTNEKPYKKSERTAPAFIITDDRNFEKEKSRLLTYLQLTVDKGTSFFEGKESTSFGALTATEWNNMFYKHLDHHLTQFGV